MHVLDYGGVVQRLGQRSPKPLMRVRVLPPLRVFLNLNLIEAFAFSNSKVE